MSSDEVTTILDKVAKRYDSWKLTSFDERAKLLLNLAELLLSKTRDLAELATLEMGKPITQSISEVEKCAQLCTYYAEHGASFLADEELSTDYEKTLVSFEPLGAILAVMPWNFPFWQAFRFAVPTVFAGNVGLLKHASNVPQCAQQMEKLFLEAGFPQHTFTNLQIKTDDTEKIITSDIVKAVSLTGSEKAGGIVASQAAKEIKSAVLELGGSDPFIVCEDADIEHTLEQAITGRFQNNGQSCIAAKRFIIHENVYENFMNGFEVRTRNLKVGDPMEEDTYIGPLAKKDFVEDIMKQINESIEKGATLRCGGAPTGDQNQYLLPTILENVSTGMPAFDDEIFGPVASCMKFSKIDEAIAMANNSQFGLGASVWTTNKNKGLEIARKIESGTVAVNDIVKSDPRVPFGGIKKSGFGRELSKQGIREFVNKKAIHIK